MSFRISLPISRARSRGADRIPRGDRRHAPIRARLGLSQTLTPLANLPAGCGLPRIKRLWRQAARLNGEHDVARRRVAQIVRGGQALGACDAGVHMQSDPSAGHGQRAGLRAAAPPPDAVDRPSPALPNPGNSGALEACSPHAQASASRVDALHSTTTW